MDLNLIRFNSTTRKTSIWVNPARVGVVEETGPASCEIQSDGKTFAIAENVDTVVGRLLSGVLGNWLQTGTPAPVPSPAATGLKKRM